MPRLPSAWHGRPGSMVRRSIVRACRGRCPLPAWEVTPRGGASGSERVDRTSCSSLPGWLVIPGEWGGVMTVGECLRQLRDMKHLSQDELGQRANVPPSVIADV